MCIKVLSKFGYPNLPKFQRCSRPLTWSRVPVNHKLPLLCFNYHNDNKTQKPFWLQRSLNQYNNYFNFLRHSLEQNNYIIVQNLLDIIYNTQFEIKTLFTVTMCRNGRKAGRELWQIFSCYSLNSCFNSRILAAFRNSEKSFVAICTKSDNMNTMRKFYDIVRLFLYNISWHNVPTCNIQFIF